MRKVKFETLKKKKKNKTSKWKKIFGFFNKLLVC